MNSASWVDEALARLEQTNPWYRTVEHTASPKLQGVNVWGYLRDESGWGAAVRGYVRALRRLGVPLALYDLSDSSTNRSGDTSLGVIGEPATYDVNLVCIDPTRPIPTLGDTPVNF